jgi:hypothetical protein
VKGGYKGIAGCNCDSSTSQVFAMMTTIGSLPLVGMDAAYMAATKQAGMLRMWTQAYQNGSSGPQVRLGNRVRKA